ncbi:MAG: CDGSH iron-sulfur domain-containing protein [Salinisphaeraceae bacterium]|nr:CDGSH iron-sulfur domain-containing protein [Salinisphaeraceae bacterium]
MKLADGLPEEPYVLELAPGDYLWCACGESKNQPFCDGSHQGSGQQPIKFTVSKRDRYIWLCGCKHTRRPPFCDGQHNKLGNKKGA